MPSREHAPTENPAERAKRQLLEFKVRHKIIDSGDFERRAKAGHKGKGDPPHASTYRRIMAANGKRGPERDTLRAIAEAFGETLEQAFPEAEPAWSETIAGRVYHLRVEDGQPPDPKVTALLNLLSTGVDVSFSAGARDAPKADRQKPRKRT